MVETWLSDLAPLHTNTFKVQQQGYAVSGMWIYFGAHITLWCTVIPVEVINKAWWIS